ncbi:substrate-binding domain-containing protein [Microbacterium sp. Se5.02b]|uniref:substrate-binding domain-containing protein n=1 Tax=Microbacterium sp. Se5.02b TaxID=2864103 RepID=UPI00215D8075|nr:substrate-binding domain-containing protein [Microbacterium sp. Se5.02b]
MPGATPGKWIDAWKQRMPHVPLELVPIEAATQRAALDEVDAALVRLPLTDESLHIIPCTTNSRWSSPQPTRT